MITITKNQCYFTDIWVSPKDFKKAKKASLTKQWYVQCYFYDPKFKDKYPKGFPYRKKINKFQTLKERIEAAEYLLLEIPALFKQGYNPITKLYMVDKEDQELDPTHISEESSFLHALNWAYNNVEVSQSTKNDIKGILKYVTEAVVRLAFDELEIKTVKKKHIRFVLDNIQKETGPFSAHKFNKYRSYLSILFKELEEYEIIENNFVKSIRKKTELREPREVLTKEQRTLVNNHLKDNYISFWRFTNIFFHSGARISELLDLKVKDVNLDKGTFRILVKKGKQFIHTNKVIKDIALPFWERAIIGAHDDQYVFSNGLVPGDNRIRREQIQRRWKTHVKDKLGITADFYALKHLNLDDIAEIYSIEDAASAAGHTSTRMVITHYAVGEKERRNNKIRVLNNNFG
ncbi:tyrosine-type recombinase/integrase [Myroides odoratimimus]|uniref:tyrosine-type recombinase/integrase n=1 Tax=Myroides odoratimimus TaxID=76832 RepID=UPI000469AB94|nr:site-specific integrase [Myroides odoratimimus]